jgi:simple sugar transport system substrate-binding protein
VEENGQASRPNADGRGLNRRQLMARSALGTALASMPLLAAACGGDDGGGGGGGGEAAGAGPFPETPRWKFVFVNHVTTNAFFVPTQYGATDASEFLNVDWQWTGSQDSNVAEMVDAMNSAISAKADGIALADVDPDAFAGPVQRALDAGIPVVTYNADGTLEKKTDRLGYVGQDLFLSGQEMGNRIVSIVDSGKIGLFIATPGQANIQPRIDGAVDSIKKSKKDIEYDITATGAEVVEELSRVESYYNGNRDIAGMFAVDQGSTQGVAQVIQKNNLQGKVKGGGFDLVDVILRAIDAGNLDFTIDQQPYLQGFLPVFYLYLYKLSGGVSTPPDTNTGLAFVTKDNVGPYLQTKTRFEGDTKEYTPPPSTRA